jgi:hypothetical protein
MYLILEPRIINDMMISSRQEPNKFHGWYTDDINVVYETVRANPKIRVFTITEMQEITSIVADYKVEFKK